MLPSGSRSMQMYPIGGGIWVAPMPRHPASAALAAISSIASGLVSSIPRCANGASTSCGAPLNGSVSGKNCASTRTNGLSGESDWPSHAPYPKASDRRSSSSSGVNSLYHLIEASMSLTRSAMCVQRGVGGWTSYTCSLTGPPLGDLRVVAALGPQHERVAPRVLDGVGILVVADEDPDANRVARVRDVARVGAVRIGMRPGVGDVEDAHVQVARGSGLAVDQEVVAGHDAVEQAGRAGL